MGALLQWFTDEAIAQCRKTQEIYEAVMPLSGKALAMGVDWLQKASRLRLATPLIPNGAEERRVAHLADLGAGLDTPWDATVIEYEHGGVYDVAQDYTRALSTRRLALCVKISNRQLGEFGEQEDDFAAGSLLVWPISYFDEKKEWEFAPGVVIVPRAQAQSELRQAANQYLALLNWIERTVLSVLGRQQALEPMVVRYQPMMPELCEKLGEVHSEKMIRESSMDALWVALGTFSAMSCENVFYGPEEKDLVSYSRQRRPSALDPFRGRRAMRWNGRQRWEQHAVGLEQR